MPAEDRLISVTYTGLLATTRKIAKIKRAVNNVDLNHAVRAMAGVWQSNFDSEGASVGRWRDLTEMTNRVRVQRGYPPEHPILVQSGALKHAAVTSLLNVNGPRLVTAKGVMMSWQPVGNQGTLSISGPKVDNQFRVRGSGFSSPARRFWYVDSSVEGAATEAIGQWIEREIS